MEAWNTGPPIVINAGWREVVAVGQRGAGNFSSARVNGIQTHSDVRGTIQPGGFALEFLRQSLIDPCAFAAFDLVRAHLVAGFFEKACALHSGPRTQALVASLNKTQRLQAVEQRVNPTVRRHVRRTHVLGIALLRLVARLE